ncbi:MAG: TlpA disulfide reductase family protein [Planctomycetota bacterium]|jgi:thiol-disulfide isomerase/thioredoxin
MMRSVLTAGVLLGLCATPATYAGDDELTIGDEAPKIEISHWLKGEQFEEFENDQVYVMEFWATWCGPCIASMPHISELQEKYADYDVTFVGVSDEPLPTVVSFLFKEHKGDGKIHNDRTQYTLTTDPDKSVYKSYMTAAGQRGIPTAFIVGKDQHIEWIGHPMSIDEPLDAVVRDSWDRDAFKVKFEKKMAAAKAERKAHDQIRKAMVDGDHAEAIRLMDDFLEEQPDNIGLKQQKFTMLLVQMDKPAEAYEYADQVITEHWDEAMLLNQIAWFIVDDPQVKTRDFKIAMRAAKRASELTENKDGAILDTVARVYYESGDLDAAIKWQRKAVKYAEGTPMEADLRKALQKYEKEAG